MMTLVSGAGGTASDRSSGSNGRTGPKIRAPSSAATSSAGPVFRSTDATPLTPPAHARPDARIRRLGLGRRGEVVLGSAHAPERTVGGSGLQGARRGRRADGPRVRQRRTDAAGGYAQPGGSRVSVAGIHRP